MSSNEGDQRLRSLDPHEIILDSGKNVVLIFRELLAGS